MAVYIVHTGIISGYVCIMLYIFADFVSKQIGQLLYVFGCAIQPIGTEYQRRCIYNKYIFIFTCDNVYTIIGIC